jgi:transcriptional regulator with XRE-family HTH domain
VSKELGRRRSMPVGAAVRQARLGAGLTQTDLGRALGVTQAAVSYWESGQNIPSWDDLASIEKACRLPRGAIFRLAGFAPEYSVVEAILTDPDLTSEYRRLLAEEYRSLVELTKAKRVASHDGDGLQGRH